MKKVLVLHGVNLNMFGKRDSAVYGTVTFEEILDVRVTSEERRQAV